MQIALKLLKKSNQYHMKKLFIVISTLSLLISCEDKKPPNNLEITGYIKDLKKGTLYIKKIKDTSSIAVDTIQINGDAHFKSNIIVTAPEMYYLILDRGTTISGDNSISFFAEPGKMSIESTLAFYSSDVKITGSKNQALYDEYKKVANQFVDQNLDLVEAKFAAYQTKNNLELTKIQQKQDAILKRRYLYTTNFAVNNGDYEVAPYITLAEISDINIKYLDTIQKRLSAKVAKSMYGKKLSALIVDRKK